MSTDNPTFDYRNVRLNQIQLDAVPAQEISEEDKRFLARSGGAMAIHGGKSVRRVLIDGEPVRPTGRFWTSLYSRFGLNTAFFKFFSHDEVFKRISEKETNDRVSDRDRNAPSLATRDCWPPPASTNPSSSTTT
jgi:hypothetical protein